MKLTSEQIENWRLAMLPVIGPYALVMSEEDIQSMRDKLQKRLDVEADVCSHGVPYRYACESCYTE